MLHVLSQGMHSTFLLDKKYAPFPQPGHAQHLSGEQLMSPLKGMGQAIVHATPRPTAADALPLPANTVVWDIER